MTSTRSTAAPPWDPDLHAAITEAVTLAYRAARSEPVELFGEVTR